MEEEKTVNITEQNLEPEKTEEVPKTYPEPKTADYFLQKALPKVEFDIIKKSREKFKNPPTAESIAERENIKIYSTEKEKLAEEMREDEICTNIADNLMFKELFKECRDKGMLKEPPPSRGLLPDVARNNGYKTFSKYSIFKDKTGHAITKRLIEQEKDLEDTIRSCINSGYVYDKTDKNLRKNPLKISPLINKIKKTVTQQKNRKIIYGAKDLSEVELYAAKEFGITNIPEEIKPVEKPIEQIKPKSLKQKVADFIIEKLISFAYGPKL